MLKAVLFDLDDTLLGNAMDTFLPAYFQALTRYLDHLIPPERLMADLMQATKVMNGDIMLIEQTAAAFTLWTGEKAPVDVIKKQLKAHRNQPDVPVPSAEELAAGAGTSE